MLAGVNVHSPVDFVNFVVPVTEEESIFPSEPRVIAEEEAMKFATTASLVASSSEMLPEICASVPYLRKYSPLPFFVRFVTFTIGLSVA